MYKKSTNWERIESHPPTGGRGRHDSQAMTAYVKAKTAMVRTSKTRTGNVVHAQEAEQAQTRYLGKLPLGLVRNRDKTRVHTSEYVDLSWQEQGTVDGCGSINKKRLRMAKDRETATMVITSGKKERCFATTFSEGTKATRWRKRKREREGDSAVLAEVKGWESRHCGSQIPRWRLTEIDCPGSKKSAQQPAKWGASRRIQEMAGVDRDTGGALLELLVGRCIHSALGWETGRSMVDDILGR